MIQVLTPQNIGQLIKTTRKNRELTQRQVALACNVGLRFISELENGKLTIQLDKMFAVLKGLGLQILVK